MDASGLSFFDLTEWNRITPDEKIQGGKRIVEFLNAKGCSLSEPPVLRTFGPSDQPQTILQFKHDRAGLTFSLIPGGIFRPGYSPELLAIFDKIWAVLQGDEIEMIKDNLKEPDLPDDDRRHLQARIDDIQSMPVTHLVGEFDLNAKDPVRIQPFLMAAEIVTDECLRQVGPISLNSSARSVKSYCTTGSGPDEGNYPLHFLWDEVAKVNSLFGWDLAESWEFEWAIRGGMDWIFPWGNRIPSWIWEYQGSKTAGRELLTEEVKEKDLINWRIAPERPRTWPWCNRFGLTALLEQETWCKPRPSPDPAVPLLTRGGASWRFPWQYCREWLMLLCAWENRRAPIDAIFGREPTAALRPIFRF